MLRLRRFVALLLTLSLAFGSVAEALARNQMAGAGGQVICGSDGTRLISLDASGNPVTAHPCTHCLAAAIAGVLAYAADLTAPVILHATDLPRPALSQAGIARHAQPHARGPPRFAV